MEFEEFSKLLIDELKKHYEEDTQFRVNQVTKNNGITLQALAILDEGATMTPNIYLDEYYEKYNRGLTTIHSIVEDIVHQREVASSDNIGEVKYAWDDVKDKLFCRIVNKERNQERLKNSPHMEYLDLAVTVRVLQKKDEKGIASSEVDYKWLELLGVSEEELFAQAKMNTETLFPIKREKLVDVILDCMDVPVDLREVMYNKCPCPMYVITNDIGLNGATVILYTNALRDLATDLEVDHFYIMPCSVHECIVMVGDDDVESMKSIVMTANKDVVTQMDYLADSVYRYDLESDNVELVA